MCLRKILHRCGADVRNAPVVAIDRDLLLKAGKGNASVDLRQRTVNKPPHERARENDKKGHNPEEESQNASQCHSGAI